MQLSTGRKQSRKSTTTTGARRRASTRPAELARRLTGFFRYTSTTCDGDFLEEVTQTDLSLSQLKVLSFLSEHPDEVSVNGLAQELGISLPSASRSVDPLVRRKLVVRKEDADDRRVKRVRLTPKGEKLVDRLVAARTRSFERMLAGFSERERRKLAAALELILERPEIGRYTPRGGRR